MWSYSRHNEYKIAVKDGEGQDRDDTEGYEFDGSRWYVALSAHFLVPVGQKSRGLDRLEEMRSELKQL